MSLSVVTVIHDSAGPLERMLGSLELLGSPGPEVICVDSGSTDDGAEIAARAGATVISLEGNPGFGAACNTGVAAAGGEACALLNPDTRLLDDGLLRLADIASQSRAILAPRLLNPDGSLQRSAHPVPGGTGALAGAFMPPRLLPAPVAVRLEPFRSGAPVVVGWAIGACLVASTRLFRELGPFDPGAFLYAEDMDLCLRARAAGAPVVYRPDVEVIHEGGHSTEAAFGELPRLEMQARRRREVVGSQLGAPAVRRDDLAETATYGLRALVGRRRRENLAKLRALREAQKSPS
ncbi:MAG: glycosyltransferase family 2 protein [Solirubrobacterales bacterium]